MSLLDPPNILPNAMFLICKALAPRGPFDRRRLRALLQPSSLKLRQSGTNSYDAALRALVDLRMVERSDDEVTLTEGVTTTSPALFYVDLLRAVMATALDPEGPSQDLLRVLTWWAAQDPYGRPFDWTTAERQMVRQYQDPARRPVTNSNPYNSFARWAVALGFAEWSSDKIVPDGTRAVRTVSTSLGPRGSVPIETFLADLRDRLPVIDGGRFSRGERQFLHDDASLKVDGRAVDTYLTHALLRCHEDGVITLSAPSDADQLLLSDGAVGVPCSHVEVKAGVAA
ncbi:protein DpdG [Blastococcus sp. SYSU DS0510]